MLKKLIIESQNKGGWACLADYYVNINIISNTYLCLIKLNLV